MKKRPAMLFASIGALLLIGAGFVWHARTGPQSDQPTPPSETDRPQAAAAGNAPGVQAVPSLPASSSPSQTKQSWVGVSTFGQLQRSGMGTSAAQHLHDLKVAAQVCEGLERAKSGPQPKRVTDSLKTYESFASSFCADFNGSAAAFERQLLEHGSSDVVVASAVADGADASLNETERLQAESIFLKSPDPTAVQLAAFALVGKLKPGEWAFGADLATNSREKASLQKAQWLAAQMVACDMSGGCGPGGFFSMVECASYGVCRPGMSSRDVWREVESPITFQLTEKLHARAVQDRNRSG